MTFDHPWLLLLLLPALLAVAWLRRQVAFRAAIVACALLAAASPRLGRRPTDGRLRVYVIDASASLGGAAEALALAKLDARDLEKRDRAGVVVVGSLARVELTPGDPDRLRTLEKPASHVPPDATRLGEGIETAASLVPEGSTAELVIVSDGREVPEGPAAVAAAAARRRGIAVRTVPCGSRRLPDARIDRVESPARVRPGERFETVVTVSSSAPLKVRVSVGDRSRDVQLDGAGAVRLAWPQEPVTTALTWIEASVETLEVRDVLPGNNRGEAPVLLEGRIPVLVLSGNSPAPSTALLSADSRLSPVESATLEDLALVSAVVLDGLPADALPADGWRALASWVSDGGGLLALGGPDGLGAGGFGETPLDPALPVETAPRDSLTLIVLLDTSGSMAQDVAPGRTKLREAQDALRALATTARPGTTLAFAAFSDRARWIAPPSVDAAPLLRELEALDAGGPTRLEPALVLAASAGGAGRTHVVIVSDGASAEDKESLAAAANRLRAAGATITAVAEGADAKTEVLELLAPGRVVLMKDFADLQRALKEDLARLQGLTATGVFDGGDGRVALQVNLCRAKDGAETLLSAGSHALAVVRPHGRGRAAVLATAPIPDWVRSPGDWAPLLSDLVRQVARPDAGGRLSLATAGDVLEAAWTPSSGSDLAAVDGTLTLPDGSSRAVRLHRTARDRFSARFTEPGVGRFVLDAAGTRAATARSWPAELRATGPRADLMAAWEGPALAAAGAPPAARAAAPWLLLAAVALLVTAAAVSLRAGPGTPKLRDA